MVMMQQRAPSRMTVDEFLVWDADDATGGEKTFRVRHLRPHRHGVGAEALDLEAERAQEVGVLGCRRRQRRLQLQGRRQQQALAAHRALGVRLAQPLEGDALVGGVLIDEHQLARRLADEVGAMQLAEVDQRREEGTLNVGSTIRTGVRIGRDGGGRGRRGRASTPVRWRQGLPAVPALIRWESREAGERAR